METTMFRAPCVVPAHSPNHRRPERCRLIIGQQALISSTVPEQKHHCLDFNRQLDFCITGIIALKMFDCVQTEAQEPLDTSSFPRILGTAG